MYLKLIKSRQIVITILLTLLIGVVDSKIYSETKYSLTSNSKKEITNKVSDFYSRKTLLLSEAVRRVLENNLGLLSLQSEIKAKDGLILQSSILPNPEIEFELENFAGSGENNRFSMAERTVQISQQILLGGKRKKKIMAATLDKELSRQNYNRKFADLILVTKKRFSKLIYIQEKLRLRNDMLLLSDQFVKKIALRVKAGKSSSAELSQAEISLMRTQIEFDQIFQEFFTSKQLLVSLWGSTKPDFGIAEGKLEIYYPVPTLSELENALSQNIDMIHISTEINHLKSLKTLERSYKIPDPSIAGGIRQFNESRSFAFTLNLSVPVPIFNRNQGNMKNAHYLLKKAEFEKKERRIMYENELNALYNNLKTNYKNASILKLSILPKSLKSIKVIEEGYDQGRFTYLNVLDAYQTQLEVRQEYLSTLLQYQYLLADIERLTGLGMKEYSTKKIKKGEKNEKK